VNLLYFAFLFAYSIISSNIGFKICLGITIGDIIILLSNANVVLIKVCTSNFAVISIISFIENKPGAGGSIASHYVFNHKGTAILAHSAAFFVRPNLYPETIYSFDQFKQNSKKAGLKLAQNLETAVKKELKSQINIRLRLLNNTLDKIRNAAGIGRMTEPTNIYKVPYFYQGISNGLGGQVSSNFFYDVHNSLRNFAGDAAGNALGGKLGGIFKGGNGTTLF
jgi:hypothetical protein